MEHVFGLIMGIGLSAACGFRVFVPLLVVSVGSHTGHLSLEPGFAWIGTTPSLAALGVATVVEVIGYLVPWVDHLLDMLAVPLAIGAGTLLTWGLLGEVPPLFRWGLALVAGGSSAGGTSGVMAALRGASTATTGGLANPLFAALESLLALFTAVMAILLPVMAIAFLVCLLLIGRRLLRKLRTRLSLRKARAAELAELEPL